MKSPAVLFGDFVRQALEAEFPFVLWCCVDAPKAERAKVVEVPVNFGVPLALARGGFDRTVAFGNAGQQGIAVPLHFVRS
jgi:hypothetical protein